VLIARPAKRDAATRFARDARVDLIEDGQAVGALVYEIGPETTTITLRGETFRAARECPRKDELLYQAGMRLALGGEKPAPNPILLIDASGRMLAKALEAGGRTAIAKGDDRFELRRRSVFSRRFDLYRDGNSAPLGSAGQGSFFSTSLTCDLKPEVPELLQAFLFALLFDMTFVGLDRSSGWSGQSA
jgi:hypothetical protein